MLYVKRLSYCGMALLAATLSGSITDAQDVDVQAGETRVQVDRNGVEVDTDRERADRPIAAGRQMNRQIAQWSMIDQQSLIELARFGLQRTKVPEIRQLTDTILRDHQNLMDKLAAASERPGERRDERRDDRGEISRDAARDRDGLRRPLENLADRIEAGVDRITDGAERAARVTRDAIDRRLDDEQLPGGRRGQGSSWISIHRDITNRLSDLARRDLERREGYEFEASFLGMMVAAHLQQEAALEILSERATGDLAQTLRQAVSTAKRHRAEAEQVMNAINR